MEMYIRLSEILEERNIMQKELAEKTGLRTAAISEICANQRKTVNRYQLGKIAHALGIENSNELVEFRK